MEICGDECVVRSGDGRSGWGEEGGRARTERGKGVGEVGDVRQAHDLPVPRITRIRYIQVYVRIPTYLPGSYQGA